MACKVFVLAVVVLSLIGTALGRQSYCNGEDCALSESELESVIRKAYREGYQAGYDRGIVAGLAARQQLPSVSTQIPGPGDDSSDVPAPPYIRFNPGTNSWELRGNFSVPPSLSGAPSPGGGVGPGQ